MGSEMCIRDRISIHNLPLVEAVDRELRFVPVRHEAAAINAADGYARATGGIGVALTSTGTGAGNAAGSMLVRSSGTRSSVGISCASVLTWDVVAISVLPFRCARVRAARPSA